MSIAGILFAATLSAASAAEPELPPWLFIVPPGGGAAAAKKEEPVLHVPNSTVGLTRPQISDLHNIPDWHPDGHPKPPDSVVHGGRGVEFDACGYCHLPNGQGRPENTSLAGLSAAYIVQQVQDYRAGRRKSSEPRMLPPTYMAAVSRNAPDKAVQEAAEYFESLKPMAWVKVVEGKMAPKTEVSQMLVPVKSGEQEPIGDRILEVPVNPEQTALRDDHSGFIAYVPPGSIKEGERLVKTGVGGGAPCRTCHGEDLKGLGPVPRLAGRSPTYLARTMVDFKTGARAGTWSALMMPTITNMTQHQMVALAAYLGSLAP
jgi:cytochrome c553